MEGEKTPEPGGGDLARGRESTRQGSASPASSRLMVVGDTALASRICGGLSADNDAPLHFVAPDDRTLQNVLATGVEAVAIAVRDDVQALRYALAIAHLDRNVLIAVKIFDRTIADRIRELLPQALVTSPADLAAPSLAGPCLGTDVIAAWHEGGHDIVMTGTAAGPVLERRVSRRPARLRQFIGQLVVRLASHDAGTRLLLIGLAGLTTVLVVDWVWLVVTTEHDSLIAFLEAARVVAGVGPGPSHASGAYAAFSSAAMLATIVFTAIFTAGLVDRLLDPRLLGLFGTRRAPRSDHVIVVGMGQVGVRLCEELRRLGVPAIGVERDTTAAALRVARALKIPVVPGHGGDRELLQHLGLKRARALAAVGSDDLDNIAVAIAASAVSASTRVLLRAGEQEAISETRSLLPLGATRDVLDIAATYVVRVMSGHRPLRVISDGTNFYVVDSGQIFTAEAARDRTCAHQFHTEELAAAAPGAPDRLQRRFDVSPQLGALDPHRPPEADRTAAPLPADRAQTLGRDVPDHAQS